MKKREKAAQLIQTNAKIFKCPLCSRKLQIKPSGSLVCESGHCFDLSKKGHLNLLLSASPPSYPKELFEARRRVCDAGFYDPFISELVRAVQSYLPEGQNLSLLDAGCGEGSHLYGLSRLLPKENKAFFVGVDISKESIQLAAAMESDILWCVADLARLPFHNESFFMILNILSPANYEEFTRLLKQDGLVIKVIPGADYLREIRDAVYGGTEKNEYSSESIQEHFAQRLEVLEVRSVLYTFLASDLLLPDILRMTPLTRDVESLEQLHQHIPKAITVDLKILIGRKTQKKASSD